jgi:hypothetical protein
MAALEARSLLTRETIHPTLVPQLGGGGRHHQNAGRLEIRTVGAISSERRAASDRNRWAPYVRNRIYSDTTRPTGNKLPQNVVPQIKRNFARKHNKILKLLTSPRPAAQRTVQVEPDIAGLPAPFRAARWRLSAPGDRTGLGLLRRSRPALAVAPLRHAQLAPRRFNVQRWLETSRRRHTYCRKIRRRTRSCSCLPPPCRREPSS